MAEVVLGIDTEEALRIIVDCVKALDGMETLDDREDGVFGGFLAVKFALCAAAGAIDAEHLGGQYAKHLPFVKVGER